MSNEEKKIKKVKLSKVVPNKYKDVYENDVEELKGKIIKDNKVIKKLLTDIIEISPNIVFN